MLKYLIESSNIANVIDQAAAIRGLYDLKELKDDLTKLGKDIPAVAKILDEEDLISMMDDIVQAIDYGIEKERPSLSFFKQYFKKEIATKLKKI